MFRNVGKGKAFVCYKCDKSFSSQDEMVLHLKLTHNACASPDCRKISDFKMHSSTCHYRGFHCVVCHEKFSEKYLYLMHFNQHIDVAFYACEICRDGFQQRKDLQRHLWHIHGKREIIHITPPGCKAVYQKCCQCSKYFKLFFEYQEHKTLCNSATYICDICFINFTSLTSLMNHKSIEHKHELSVRGHSALMDGKQYFCGICYLGFFKGDTLKDHIKTHEVKAFYMCEVCHLSFASDNDMQMHYLQHIEEHYALHNVIQQHSCSDCKRTFKSQVHLEDHFKLKICSNKAARNNLKSVFSNNGLKSCFQNFEKFAANDSAMDRSGGNAVKDPSNGVIDYEPQLDEIPVYILKAGDKLLNCDDHKCVVVIDRLSLYILQRGACASENRMPDLSNTEAYLEDDEIDASMLQSHMLQILGPTEETDSSNMEGSVSPVIHDVNDYEQDLNMESDSLEALTFDFQ